MPSICLRAPAPADDAKADPAQRVGGVGAERAEPHHADRNSAGRPLRFRRPAFGALRLPQVKFLPVMHQHVQHDVFGHPFGEIVDRDAHQRHVGQRLVRHQRIDAGAEVEDDAQVGEGGEFPRLRLPDRRVMHLGRIERRVRQLQHAPSGADLVEPVLPALRRPVFGPAMHQQSERTLVHWHLYSLLSSSLFRRPGVGVTCIT